MQFRDRLKITADYEVYSKQENQPWSPIVLLSPLQS
jgi:hypothetical protein